jgi:hypothetical protein
MRRFVLLTALAYVLSIPLVLAQPQTAAKPAKYIPPVKGLATIDVIQMPSKRVGNEMVTVIKVRNTSKGAINLLKADEYWYDKSMKIVSGTPYAHKKAPIQPGEIIEITLRSPIPKGVTLYQNQILFRHANGDAKATKVKEFK